LKLINTATGALLPTTGASCPGACVEGICYSRPPDDAGLPAPLDLSASGDSSVLDDLGMTVDDLSMPGDLTPLPPDLLPPPDLFQWISQRQFSIDGLQVMKVCTELDLDLTGPDMGHVCSMPFLGGGSVSTNLNTGCLVPATTAPFQAGTVAGDWPMITGANVYYCSDPMFGLSVMWPVGTVTYKSVATNPTASAYHRVSFIVESSTATSITYRLFGTFVDSFTKVDSANPDAGVQMVNGSGSWTIKVTYPYTPVDGGGTD
jgi:hypothetical protein